MSSGWASQSALSTLKMKGEVIMCIFPQLFRNLEIALKTHHAVPLTWMSTCGGGWLMVMVSFL